MSTCTKSLSVFVLLAIWAPCCGLQLVSGDSENKGDDSPVDRRAELLDEFVDSRLFMMDHMPALNDNTPLKNKHNSLKSFRDGADKMLFIVHRKMGSSLLDSLVHEHLAPALRSEVSERWEGWFEKYGLNRAAAFEHQVCFYSDPEPQFLKKMLDLYPELRIVHLIRDPISQVVSAVQHHRRQHQVEDSIPAFELFAELQYKSQDYLQPLRRVKDVCEELDGNENVQTVRYEDFVSDYDDTTRKIFTHVLGIGHPLIESLVKSSQADDVGRWDTTKLAEWSEDAMDKSVKMALFDGIQTMIDEQEDPAMEMMRIREELGY